MDIYLKELSNPKSQFRFPSMPDDDITISRKTQYQDYNIISRGSINFPNGMGDQSVKWSGYFWGSGRRKSSINRKWISPSTCVKKIESWQKKGTPLRLVVSGGGINLDVTIQSFTHRVFGGHGDISYDISFVPYKEIKIYTTKELGVNKASSKKKKTTRNSTSKSNKKNSTYKAVKGDTLCGISRKKYGTESKWTDIYKANKSIIEKEARKHGYKSSDNGWWIFPGTILTIP